MPRIEYQSNNSGGSWWLNDEQWLALERAGWQVEWLDKPFAMGAVREGLSFQEAVAEWERVTGCSAKERGCDCCCRPHFFRDRDEEDN